MSKVGFSGGSSIIELGFISDMQLFFDCINYYVVPAYPEIDFSLITDRLYKRYLKLDDLDLGLKLMKIIQEKFQELDRESVDWQPMETGIVDTKLDIYKENLYRIYHRYFSGFNEIVDSCYSFDESFRDVSDYEPRLVMISLSDIPIFFTYNEIPLTVFDALNENEGPIWKTGKIPERLAHLKND